MKKLISLILIIILAIQFSACGGLHSNNSIHAKNMITEESIKIDFKVDNYSDTGNFSNFSVNLSYTELLEELRSKENINTVTDLNYGHMRLDTNNGEFYVKLNSKSNDEYFYSFYADVGKYEDFGEYIYIPFHLLSTYENSDYPAYATPFQGDVFYNHNYDIDDFAEYYKSKDVYSVEKVADTILRITDSKKDYSFVVELFPKQEMFLIHNA